MSPGRYFIAERGTDISWLLSVRQKDGAGKRKDATLHRLVKNNAPSAADYSIEKPRLRGVSGSHDFKSLLLDVDNSSNSRQIDMKRGRKILYRSLGVNYIANNDL